MRICSQSRENYLGSGKSFLAEGLGRAQAYIVDIWSTISYAFCCPPLILLPNQKSSRNYIQRLCSWMICILLCIQLRLGLTRVRRRMEKRRVARLGVWRAGLWTDTYTAKGALTRWRRHARAQRDIQLSIRIARSRSQTRKMARARCWPLDRVCFKSLKRHTRDRKLERRVLRAWAFHTERVTRASKQVSAYAQVHLCKAVDTFDALSERRSPEVATLHGFLAIVPFAAACADRCFFFLMSCEYRGTCG